MKLFNGNETIKFEKVKDKVIVNLDKTQVDLSEISVIRNYTEVVSNDVGIEIRYELASRLLSFPKASKDAKTRLEKIRLACQLSSLQKLNGKFQIPFLHPDNIYFDGENLKIIHFGLLEIMSPKELDEDLFLKEAKALVLSIFHSKLSFENILGGMESLKDSFSVNISSANTIEELFVRLNTELIKEKERIKHSKRLVSRNQFNFYRIFGSLALISAITMGFFLYKYKTSNEKQEAIIDAQTSFITNNYAKTQTELEKYQTSDLPKGANYILAVSSVNLSDLTPSQKEVILNTLSTKTDENTLNYWVNMGRGNFEEALNLAQNLGDEQLILLAYTDLYEATKLNTKMAGDKKQKLLQEYTKQIDELTKKLGK